MTTPQHSIESGFGASSTAREVLRGLDLSGTLAIVTGGYSGLGLQTTRALVDAGARVVVPARRPDLAREALGDFAEVDELDLASLDSVREFAERFTTAGRGIHMVINNAAVMACPETRVGPGWEAQFAINHLGHYALINRLWPALGDGARVVAVSSGAHRRSDIQWNDVQFERGYDKWQAYGQSKTANILFAVQLDLLGRPFGVRALSTTPGSILTPLQRHLATEEMVAAGWIDENGTLINPAFKTPEQGAATQAWAAVSPQLAGMGGVYCKDCDIARQDEEDGVRGYAIDPGSAARLWRMSAELTGVDAFAPDF